MHQNRATVLYLQYGMNSEPETFLYIDIQFGPPEVMWYCPLWNNQATIRSIVVKFTGLKNKFSICNIT
jgi:hypothetical protein